MTNKLEEEKADVINTAKKGIGIAKIFLQHCKKEDRPLWQKRKKLCEDFIEKASNATSQLELRQLYTTFIIADTAQ